MIRLFFISACILCFIPALAKRDLSYFWSDKDGIIKAQTELTFELVNEIISKDKPTCSEPSQSRKAALYLLDQILHDTRLDGSKLVSDFLNSRMDSVVRDLDRPLTEGIKVYKLYNDGWIVKSPQVTVGWDIYRGPKVKDSDMRLMSDSVAKELVKRVDIMFLTHNHGDHVDQHVVDLFLDEGKPVVAPNQVLPDEPRIFHSRKEEIWREKFNLANNSSISVSIVPGHQDHLENNIYIVTLPNGYNVCSSGDQWLKSDTELILNLKGKIPEVDVFMPICWAARLPEFCESFGAKVVLTGHENELGHHSIDHREAYWLSYNKLEDFPFPNCLMTWGEVFEYKK